MAAARSLYVAFRLLVITEQNTNIGTNSVRVIFCVLITNMATGRT